MTAAPARQSDRPGPVIPGPASAAGTSATGTSARGASARGASATGASAPGPDGPAAETGQPPVSAELMAPRGRWSRVGWLFAAIWLVYLAQPAGKLWSDPNLARRYLGLADLIAFAAVFIVTFAAARFLRDFRNRRVSRRIGVAALAAETVLAGLAYAALGPSAGSLFIYVGVMAVFLLPTRVGWAAVGAFVAVSLIVPWANGWTVDGTMAFQIFVSALAAWGVSHVIQRNAQLVEARNEITRLALAEQRNRFARDLHDILGHSLTVVAVKAELAGRLASLDPQRAETEIADVERIARQALADVRAAAAGYREVTWPASWPVPGPRWPPRASRRTCPARASPASPGRARSCSGGRCAKASPTWCGTAAPRTAGSGSPPARSRSATTAAGRPRRPTAR